MRTTTEPPSSRKVRPHPDYPAEEGRYLRGNDFSPVAVAVVLNTDEDKIPPEIEAMVRAGVESGAALSGTVQTPNIGFEKIIWNIVGNPNIRYLVLAGPESEGHRTGDALKALFANGIDEKARVIGTEAANAVLYNVPREVVARFLDQVTLVDCQFQDIPTLRAAIRACYQETPTEFQGPAPLRSGCIPGRADRREADLEGHAAVGRAEGREGGGREGACPRPDRTAEGEECPAPVRQPGALTIRGSRCRTGDADE